MATFVVLGSWTDEGARAARDTVKRAEVAREAARKLGGDITHIWWTMGHYDLVAILEAPDDETATAIMVAISGSGMVRSETLRAFDAQALTGILAKVG
ncbi:MAG: GYD domain-containing protein [Thermomicrobiales bacterium]